jgi:hypothetical protein
MRHTFLPRGLKVLILGAFLLPACQTGTREITQESPHSVGQRYRTKVDFYLYTLQHGGPYVGINDGKAGYRDLVLPPTVSAQYVGQKYKGAQILDVVPMGSELLVTKIYRNVSSQGVRVWFVCDIAFKGQQVHDVSTSFIQSRIDGREGKLPVIDPRLPNLCNDQKKCFPRDIPDESPNRTPQVLRRVAKIDGERSGTGPGRECLGTDGLLPSRRCE